MKYVFIDAQFSPLYVFCNAIGTLWLFRGTKHNRHVVVACRPSKIACCIVVFEVVSHES